MQEGNNEMVKMAVGLILMLLVAAIAFGIYRVGHGISSKATGKLTEFGSEMDIGKFTELDNEVVTGSQVLAYISDMKGETFTITIMEGTSQLSSFDCSDSTAYSTAVTNLKKKGTATYLNPAKTYSCVVTMDGNIPTVATFTRVN